MGKTTGNPEGNLGGGEQETIQGSGHPDIKSLFNEIVGSVVNPILYSIRKIFGGEGGEKNGIRISISRREFLKTLVKGGAVAVATATGLTGCRKKVHNNSVAANPAETPTVAESPGTDADADPDKDNSAFVEVVQQNGKYVIKFRFIGQPYDPLDPGANATLPPNGTRFRCKITYNKSGGTTVGYENLEVSFWNTISNNSKTGELDIDLINPGVKITIVQIDGMPPSPGTEGREIIGKEKIKLHLIPGNGIGTRISFNNDLIQQ